MDIDFVCAGLGSLDRACIPFRVSADWCGRDGGEWNFFAGLAVAQQAHPNASKQMIASAVFLATLFVCFTLPHFQWLIRPLLPSHSTLVRTILPMLAAALSSTITVLSTSIEVRGFRSLRKTLFFFDCSFNSKNC